MMKMAKRKGYISEYIFCDSEGRTKIREIDHCIRKMYRKAGIEVKSAHDIRRTVASELYAGGVMDETIREYMGHSDLKTTYEYILNNQGKDETANQIHNALKNFSIFTT